MKAIPLKTFLLKTVEKDGKFSDVIAYQGVAIDITDQEYKKFGGKFQLLKDEKKKEEEEDKDDFSKKKSNR